MVVWPHVIDKLALRAAGWQPGTRACNQAGRGVRHHEGSGHHSVSTTLSPASLQGVHGLPQAGRDTAGPNNPPLSPSYIYTHTPPHTQQPDPPNGPLTCPARPASKLANVPPAWFYTAACLPVPSLPFFPPHTIQCTAGTLYKSICRRCLLIYGEVRCRHLPWSRWEAALVLAVRSAVIA